MFEISFSLKNYDNEPVAHMKFRSAMQILDRHQIFYKQSVDDVLYNGKEGINSRRTFYTVYKIVLFTEEDYLAYMMIKD